MLDPLKRQLKDLVARGRHEEVFRQLREDVLAVGSEVYNDCVLIQGRFSEAERAGNLGLIAFQEKDRNFNNINEALLWLIDCIEVADLSEVRKKQLDVQQAASARQAVPPRHVLTCNRMEQTELVQLNYYDLPGPEEKIRFFYLYGDIRQEHQSLFRRLGYELGGFLLNWEKGDYDPGVQVKFVHCKPQVHRNPKLFLINTLRELFSRFFEPVNGQQPISRKKLSDLLASPDLQGFSGSDFVFILFTIDDHNWNETVTPQVVRALIENFCDCELGPDAPAFFLFFGIEYKKDNEDVRQQVRKVIEETEYGEKLPELQPVTLDDVSEWLSRYTVLIPPGREAPDLAAELFPGQGRFDMADVEVKLREIVDRHNLGVMKE